MDEFKMTRDDIIRMAESCGIPEFENNESQADNIMRFAALVAAAEREACAKLCDELDDIRWQECGEYKSGYSEAIRARSQNDGH